MLLLAAGSPAPPVPILSAGPQRDAALRDAERTVVLGFLADMARPDGAQAAADAYLAADFRNHDRERPSGAQRYANFFLHPAQYGNPEPPAGAAAPPGMVLTDGALTLVTHQPGAEGRFDADLFEVLGGRITQIWRSGPADPASPPIAASATPTVPQGMADEATRQANLALVRGFVARFFGLGDAAAADMLATDIVSHVPSVPSGAGFAMVGHKHEDRLAPDDVGQVLFALAGGDLVAIGFALPYAGDPGARFALVVARVRAGRIAEWWYSGVPAGHPRVWRRPGPGDTAAAPG